MGFNMDKDLLATSWVYRHLQIEDHLRYLLTSSSSVPMKAGQGPVYPCVFGLFLDAALAVEG